MNIDSATRIDELLSAAAQRWADRPAVTDPTGTWTYRELRGASDRAATWLANRGVERGDRVVVVGGTGRMLAALVYGAASLGAPFILLHEQVRGPALAHVLRDAEPTLGLIEEPDELAAAGSAGGPGLMLPRAEFAAALSADEEGAATTAESATSPSPSAALAVDPVCLIYTSGTTSAPKAVVSTHAQILFAARAIQAELGYRPEDKVFCALPMSFDVGLYQLFLAALSGAEVLFEAAAEVGPALPGRLAETGATILPAVPSIATGLARLRARSGRDLPALRLLTSTGAAMPEETLSRLRAGLPGLRIQLMFGLTECKRATIMPPDGDLTRPGSCGRALPGTEILVIDDDGRPLPPGRLGQIVVRGPNVMAGYWRRPEDTAARFPRVAGLFPQLVTGDYGWLDQDGYLFFHGRRDDLYKERGFRVSGTEVELAAARCPGVRAAAVLTPRAGRPATLLVAGQVADGGRLEPAEVLRALRGQLEEYKIPRVCRVFAELPLTANGKVDRRALASRIGEDHG
jgi:acyl-CoA synthetase (AMP-forming)/AMP-acid ligase II